MNLAKYFDMKYFLKIACHNFSLCSKLRDQPHSFFPSPLMLQLHFFFACLPSEALKCLFALICSRRQRALWMWMRMRMMMMMAEDQDLRVPQSGKADNDELTN